MVLGHYGAAGVPRARFPPSLLVPLHDAPPVDLSRDLGPQRPFVLGRVAGAEGGRWPGTRDRVPHLVRSHVEPLGREER